MPRPEYRIEVRIVDEATGEVVVKEGVGFFSRMGEPEAMMGRVIDAFGKAKREFEAVHYPESYKEEEPQF